MLGKLMKNIVSRFSKRQEGLEVVTNTDIINTEQETVNIEEIQRDLDNIEETISKFDRIEKAMIKFTTLPIQVMRNQGTTLVRNHSDAFRAFLEAINQTELEKARREKIEELSGMPYNEYCEKQVLEQHSRMAKFIREIKQKEERKKKNSIKKFRLRAYAKAKGIDYRYIKSVANSKEEAVMLLKKTNLRP